VSSALARAVKGTPLLAAAVIEPAIRLIRSRTDQGTINMNTNGGLPEVLNNLLACRPRQHPHQHEQCARRSPTRRISTQGVYVFADVVRSIDLALEKGRHVAINYLNMPGFTDTAGEVDSLKAFINAHPY
jgi:hypothetical protein